MGLAGEIKRGSCKTPLGWSMAAFIWKLATGRAIFLGAEVDASDWGPADSHSRRCGNDIRANEFATTETRIHLQGRFAKAFAPCATFETFGFRPQFYESWLALRGEGGRVPLFRRRRLIRPIFRIGAPFLFCVVRSRYALVFLLSFEFLPSTPKPPPPPPPGRVPADLSLLRAPNRPPPPHAHGPDETGSTGWKDCNPPAGCAGPAACPLVPSGVSEYRVARLRRQTVPRLRATPYPLARYPVIFGACKSDEMSNGS